MIAPTPIQAFRFMQITFEKSTDKTVQAFEENK